jgi:hypothetical protein
MGYVASSITCRAWLNSRSCTSWRARRTRIGYGHGLIATTSPGGAGKWRDDYTTQLTAAGVARVVILPDNDDAGRDHANQVATSCRGARLDAIILSLPNLKPKSDVWIGSIVEAHARLS